MEYGAHRCRSREGPHFPLEREVFAGGVFGQPNRPELPGLALVEAMVYDARLIRSEDYC